MFGEARLTVFGEGVKNDKDGGNVLVRGKGWGVDPLRGNVKKPQYI